MSEAYGKEKFHKLSSERVNGYQLSKWQKVSSEYQGKTEAQRKALINDYELDDMPFFNPVTGGKISDECRSMFRQIRFYDGNYFVSEIFMKCLDQQVLKAEVLIFEKSYNK